MRESSSLLFSLIMINVLDVDILLSGDKYQSKPLRAHHPKRAFNYYIYFIYKFIHIKTYFLYAQPDQAWLRACSIDYKLESTSDSRFISIHDFAHHPLVLHFNITYIWYVYINTKFTMTPTCVGFRLCFPHCIVPSAHSTHTRIGNRTVGQSANVFVFFVLYICLWTVCYNAK